MRNLQEELARKCLCCSNGSVPFVFVFQHKSLINSLSEVLGFKVTREKYYPEILCYSCCCFINRVMEFRRLSQLRMNEFRAKAKLNGEEMLFDVGDKAKAGTKMADNDDSSVDVGKVDETPPKPKLFGQNENFKNAGFSGPIIASVQTGVSMSPIAHEDDEEEAASMTTNSAHSELANGDVSLLTVAFERAESVIDTESGGNIDRQAQEIAKASPTGFYTCPHCYKVYRKVATLEKHVKKHVRKKASQERHKRTTSKPTPECPDCGKTFETKHELKLHARVHRQRYNCDHCAKEFYNSADYKWHKAVCDGERRAQDVENSSIDGHRKTRSQRGRLSAPSDNDTDDNLSEYSVLSTPSYSAKIHSINQWIQNGRRHSPPLQSEHMVDDDDDRVSVVSGLSNITNLSDFSCCSSVAYGGGSTISIRTKYSSKSKSSVGDLMSARSSLSSRTLTRGISREISKIDLELSFRENGEVLRGDRMQQRNKKLMRLRNREAKQLMKNGATVFLCGDCIFSCDSLGAMMQHEKKKHNKLALYKCPECIQRFTQEKYLNQHVLMHPSGPFYCIHCEEHFDTKFELKVHLDLHLEKSHSCQYCDLSFLKLSQMKQHLLHAHLDRLNVHNGEAGEVTTPKTGIIDRLTFKERNTPVAGSTRAMYRAKSLVQRTGSETARRRRRCHYPYLEKLGNIDSKLVQMMRSDGQAYSDVNGPVVASSEMVSTAAVPADSVQTVKTTALSSKPASDDDEFQLPEEFDDMNLEEHGVFSVDTIPDPDLATSFSDNTMTPDNTPCSSNGNTPPHSSPDSSPTSSAPASPSKRHRKRHRINVNSKRITKQIVQNNLKLKLLLESSVLPSYTAMRWNGMAGGGPGGKNCKSSTGPWR